MADDILDEMEEDFDDNMSDILDEPLEEVSREKEETTKKGSKAGLIGAVKTLPKKILGSKKIIIIFAAGAVLILLILVILWLFVFKSEPSGTLQMEESGTQSEMIEEQAVVFEDIVELEPFERISLKTRSTMGKLSLNIALELTDTRYRKQIYGMEDRIRTIVTQQVETMTWLELRNPEGKIMLKYNLLKRINAVFPRPMVHNIYFTYFIMQQ